ncbi:MAG: DNA mismatch repair endonuclease MutL [Polyangiaceae bacterium]
MATVERLPDDLANQIAAGEVVERPSSVIKELLENSLDAGATRIRIDVEGGGIGLLRVADDGAGMSEDDALLAIERHATSKLRQIEDLSALHTFGFRGEALPSIASVSRFTLRTRQKSDAGGLEISITGGAPPEARPCGMAPGTIVEVRDLFFNVPARRKFLKAAATESAHITDVVEALALAAPSLTITLARENRIVREWLRAATRSERVSSTFAAEKLSALSGKQGPLNVEAYLAPPERARTASASLRLFVNDRLVRDRTLLRTVALAYGSVLPPGRYPVGVVFLELPPSLVDVNVHPQKAEVRFADGRAVGDALFHILSLELARAFGLPAPQNRFAPQPAYSPAPAVSPPSDAVWGLLHPQPSTAQLGFPSAFTKPSRAQNSENTNEDAQTETPVPPPVTPDPPTVARRAGAIEPTEADPWGLTPTPAPLDPAAILYPPTPGWPETTPSSSDASTMIIGLATSAETLVSAGQITSEKRVEATLKPPSLGFGELRFIAQLRHMFLVCEGPEGLVVMDQHAAAERVTFHRIKRAFSSRTVAMQPLLFPVLVEVSAEEAALVDEQQELMSAAGLEARVVGPKTIAVHGIPQLLKRGDPERLVRDLLDETNRIGGRGFSDAIDMALATMACHGSIRAGDPVSPEEAASLLKALDDCDFAGHCPHGRPIVTMLRWDELERKVGR